MDKEFLDKLKSRYINAANEQEREKVRQIIHDACNKDPMAVAQGSVNQLQETIERIDSILIRQQMEDILPFISVAYMAKTYFKKSRQWLYQRINGLSVNGKPAQFTPSELETLNFALKDMGSKLVATHISA